MSRNASQLLLTARAGARFAGRLTSGLRMQPDFLIVGAQRCGTTSMYKTLAQHPAVLPAVLHKGAHYFDTGYDHGDRWYRGHFPLKVRAALRARRAGERVLTGESSPYYMFHPLAGERIASALPEVKLLVLVRDPVERAYSSYTHEKARGFEPAETFEDAVALEPDRLAAALARFASDPTHYDYDHQHHMYLTRGHYADQLERLSTLFGRDRIHVVDSQLFFEQPRPVFAGVCEFLGLGSVENIVFEQHNARPRSPLSSELHTRLMAGFAEGDARLTEWLGAPPTWRQ